MLNFRGYLRPHHDGLSRCVADPPGEIQFSRDDNGVYYFQGKLSHLFLDCEPGQVWRLSLNVNPSGVLDGRFLGDIIIESLDGKSGVGFVSHGPFELTDAMKACLWEKM